MSRKNIEKFSSGYFFLKVYARMMHYFYYGRLRVRGKKNIPYGEPIIFAPNHQNALMDALAVLFTIPRQMVFLARADLFRKEWLSTVLTFMKILPIYRIRDGYTSLQSNSDIFDKTVEVLRSGRPLVILPEGNHAGMRHLRPFKKGIARIAFQAEESADFTLGIHIVPVGIDYSRYEKSGSELLIQYGMPIKVNDYAELYRESPPKAINALIMELKSRISELMIDITNSENYEVIDILRRNYAYWLLKQKGFHPTPWNRHAAEVEVVRIMEKYLASDPDMVLVKDLTDEAVNYRLALAYHKIQFRNPEEGLWPWWKVIGQSMLFILLLPVFLLGFANNIIPVILPKIVVKKVKDVQFRSSFKYGLSIITIPFFYLLQTLIFHWVTPWPGFYTWIYLVSLPLTGLVAIRYRLFFRRFLARLRFRRLRHIRSDQWNDLHQHRKNIHEMMEVVQHATKA